MYYENVVLKEERKGYFQDKLRAIENINDYLLTSDDETIFRTEKFIESILTKKRWRLLIYSKKTIGP